MNPITELRPRSCLICFHAAVNERTTFCLEYEQVIIDEKAAAADCPVYEPEGD